MAEQTKVPVPPQLTYCSPEPKPTVEMPVKRPRWIPKPEQVKILQSIFNNSMVNPSRDDTTKIRIQLEKYGQLTDANVYYWFHNRRFRTLRKNRLLMSIRRAGLNGGELPQAQAQGTSGGGDRGGQTIVNTGSPSYIMGSSSSSASVHNCNNSSENFISFSGPPAGLVEKYEQIPIISSPVLNNLPGMVITVFINGYQVEIGRNGPLNIRIMFPDYFLMYHSSGIAIDVNDDGSVIQNLEHGESYFTVAYP